ncbi:DNA repair protein RecN [Indibacter alkaliphilus LW1]|uniref:DNA repair protein RecN n=1 Tax=Indibacter alkaliphilus (strain CCUG 57479 / KCTC 22604 / LW1) TaxID=1189612 RepID=S2DNF5_INDAL|nr:DNA repair protein RecN [Indibacter alkaliphilus]EPA00605.1 DNA repair protein RecN [Indibacter alkaliphilus LW1]
MLKSLSISNYALIRELQMKPCSGLNMITGETGAGKSIMLGAVGLLLGNRADTKALFEENNKCVVEGSFDIQSYGIEDFFKNEDLDFDQECIIRREISPSGKSRAFVNDTPVRLETLKELGKTLMDIHSQHDNLQLGDGAYQLALVDAFSNSKNELTAYQESYKTWKKSKKAYEQLREQSLEMKKEADFNKFQLEELSVLQLQTGEQEILESDQEVLENAEEIKAKIQEILNQLQNEEFGALRMLAIANQGIGQLGRLAHKFESFQERFQSMLIELKDIAAELEDEDSMVEVDFEKLEAVRDRLNKIFHLQQKHGVDSVEALLVLEQELSEKVLKVENLDEELEKLERQTLESEKSLKEKGLVLSKKRKTSFEPFATELAKLLQQLGMENASVEISSQLTTPGRDGMDQIDILFSANKGVKAQALKQVASGGEFSRLIFAIKYIMADKMALPTLIFDEIDTGVSGEVALQMVRMMQDIAKKHQVICISHLPQVAAKGELHYFVFKDNSTEKTISKVRLLSPEERVNEIAKMIAGASPSQSAVESAKELLTN